MGIKKEEYFQLDIGGLVGTVARIVDEDDSVHVIIIDFDAEETPTDPIDTMRNVVLRLFEICDSDVKPTSTSKDYMSEVALMPLNEDDDDIVLEYPNTKELIDIVMEAIVIEKSMISSVSVNESRREVTFVIYENAGNFRDQNIGYHPEIQH